jgi:ABC-type branched-subunit amino acid transport system substrate-binding protein
MRRDGGGNWRSVCFSVMRLFLAVGATVAGIEANAARALDIWAVAPSAAERWCIVQSDGSGDQPACYENFITCFVTALARASSCIQRSIPVTPSDNPEVKRARPVPLPRVNPLLRRVRGPLKSDSQAGRVPKKPSERVKASDAPAKRVLVPAGELPTAPAPMPTPSALVQQSPPPKTHQAAVSPVSNSLERESTVLPSTAVPSANAELQQASPPMVQARQAAALSPLSNPLAAVVRSTSAPVQQAPPSMAQGQQASLSPSSNPLGQESGGNSAVRGVTDSEIRFGISAPFSGAAKELGQNIKLGIEAAFNVANASGGVYGRELRLIAADDGYEPTRTAVTMKQLYDKDQVFGLIGDVGTPTAAVALPYALDRKMLFFGAFTGAGLLRNDPPDRYVFNYRASYAEETAAVVNYLVKIRRLQPEQIAVFAQQDAYGDAGFAGVEKAMRALRGGNESTILRLNYQRNTVDVDDAVAQLQRAQEIQQKRRLPIKAVIMVPTYRAAARFIEKTRDLYPDMIYTSVSFVGSTALAEELMLLGKKYVNGVIVTQVVPGVDGHSSLVLDYKSALAKYFPGEEPDYVSLEGWVDAKVLIAALQRNGRQVDTESLVGTLENLHDLDVGLGTPVSFSQSEHQGVHKVWGTQLDATGHYQPIDLQ